MQQYMSSTVVGDPDSVANRPIIACLQALLQQELHRTSQFAIKLSEKFKAKRAERNQSKQQLDRALE